MSFWSDLLDRGATAIKNEASRRLGAEGTSAHIFAQNEAVADFERRALTPQRLGQISAAAAIAEIQRIDMGFSTWCQQLGYSRALQGAADVHALALRSIANLSSSSPPGSGGVPLPGGSSIDVQTLALVGAGAYLLFKKR